MYLKITFFFSFRCEKLENECPSEGVGELAGRKGEPWLPQSEPPSPFPLTTPHQEQGLEGLRLGRGESLGYDIVFHGSEVMT